MVENSGSVKVVWKRMRTAWLAYSTGIKGFFKSNSGAWDCVNGPFPSSTMVFPLYEEKRAHSMKQSRGLKMKIKSKEGERERMDHSSLSALEGVSTKVQNDVCSNWATSCFWWCISHSLALLNVRISHTLPPSEELRLEQRWLISFFIGAG